MEGDNPVKVYVILEQHNVTAAIVPVPKTNPLKGKPFVPWWNNAYKSLRKLKKIVMKYMKQIYLNLVRSFIIVLLLKKILNDPKL